MKYKKMWLVKREVYATNIEKAITAKGRVYSVEEASKEYQPEQTNKIGFKLKKK